MKSIVEERAVELGEYITKHNATVRTAAKKFGVSKSTVHMDVAKRLKLINPDLYSRVKLVLDVNKAQRHIRGGLATREKYKGKSNSLPAGNPPGNEQLNYRNPSAKPEA